MINDLVRNVIDTTIGEEFEKTARKYPKNSFVAVPSSLERDYYKDGFEINYKDALERIFKLENSLRKSGFGLGHRVAVALNNRPEHIILRLALNNKISEMVSFRNQSIIGILVVVIIGLLVF